MAEVYANNAKGKLAEPAAAGDTTLVLEPGHTLPSVDEGEWFRATLYRWEFGAEGIHEYDHEVVKVVAVAGDTLTVERALEGVASGFDPGTPVEMRWTAGSARSAASVDPWTRAADAAIYTYDEAGRVSGVTETVDGDQRVMAVGYRPDGSVDTVTTTFRGTQRTETFTYEGGAIVGMTAVEVEV